MFNSGSTVENISPSYLLEANSGESLSQELTDFPDVGSISEWTIKININLYNQSSSFHIFSSNTISPPLGESTHGGFHIACIGTTIYFIPIRSTDGANGLSPAFSAQPSTEYELSIERALDESINFKITNLSNNAVEVTYTENTLLVWSELVNSPIFVGGNPTTGNTSAHWAAPTGEARITKITFESPQTIQTTTTPQASNLAIIDTKVGSTYNFTIDPLFHQIIHFT